MDAVLGGGGNGSPSLFSLEPAVWKDFLMFKLLAASRGGPCCVLFCGWEKSTEGPVRAELVLRSVGHGNRASVARPLSKALARAGSADPRGTSGRDAGRLRRLI